MTGGLDDMFRLPGFSGRSSSLTSGDAGALYSGAVGRMPSHHHQPSRSLALSSIPMRSFEFSHVLSQEGQRGHICVYHGVQLISTSCWTLLGPEHHILFHISYCSRTTNPTPRAWSEPVLKEKKE